MLCDPVHYEGVEDPGLQSRRVCGEELTLIWLVFGPSGVGKSCFGKWLALEQNWMHLEIDQHPLDGIDSYKLRPEWEEFYTNRGSALPLRQAIEERMGGVRTAHCVLTFPGCFALDQRHITAADHEGMRIVNLYGSEKQCLERFLERERLSGRKLDRDWWEGKRGDVFEKLRAPISARHTIDVFTGSGTRKSHAEIFAALMKK